MADTNPPADDRAAHAANLFDLRRIIGGLFIAWGVLLIILGITDSDAEITRAADVNINLFAGIGMLVFGLLMITWALTRPLGEELQGAELGDSDEGGRGTRRDRDRPGGDGDPGS
jgi:hypothetical protein